MCALRVKEAQSGDMLQAGRVLICPGSRHMKVKHLPMGDVAVLNDDGGSTAIGPASTCCSTAWQKNSARVRLRRLMTGMGDDGAEGLGAVKKAGGMTIAQSEESCVVFGMPKAAIERGYAIAIVALDVLASTLQHTVRRSESRGQSGAGKAVARRV